MNDAQGPQDGVVSDDTPLEPYNHIQIDQEAIDAELRGKEYFARRPVPEYYRRPVKRLVHAIPPPRSKILRLEIPHQGPKRFGYALLKHRPADTLARYQTLCHLEQQAGPSYDHGYLVGSACWLSRCSIPSKRFMGHRTIRI